MKTEVGRDWYLIDIDKLFCRQVDRLIPVSSPLCFRKTVPLSVFIQKGTYSKCLRTTRKQQMVGKYIKISIFSVVRAIQIYYV